MFSAASEPPSDDGISRRGRCGVPRPPRLETSLHKASRNAARGGVFISLSYISSGEGRARRVDEGNGFMDEVVGRSERRVDERRVDAPPLAPPPLAKVRKKSRLGPSFALVVLILLGV